MSGLPPVDLSKSFGKSAGLSGLLPPRRPGGVTPKAKRSPDPANVQVPAEEATKSPRTPRRGTSKSNSSRIRGVIVYVTPEQRAWLREQALRPGHTITDAALDAIEASLDQLRPPAVDSSVSGKDGLFTRSPKVDPQLGVQVQLRMNQANLEVLDQLVRDRSFASRSALVRQAVSLATTKSPS
jgi:hypothetical protein